MSEIKSLDPEVKMIHLLDSWTYKSIQEQTFFYTVANHEDICGKQAWPTR